MSVLLERLKPKERRGSKPRCHLLTHGSSGAVAERLTAVVTPFARVAPSDCWMPEGFEQTDEAELHKAIRLLSDEHCAQVRRWWFATFRGGLQTGPSFDIASTCTMEGKPGILLVEAKAHDEELIKEEGAKPLKARSPRGSRAARDPCPPQKPSDGQKTNHNWIGEAIQAANEPYTIATGFNWYLSRDSRYQMSNRFASACKLAELGHPVILVFLGFLKATEIADQGNPLETPAQWDALVKAHSQPLFPAAVWNQRWKVDGQSFVPLIRSLDWPLEPAIEP
jgi:hypothetical protein